MSIYTVKESDLVGKIKDFPIEAVQKMVDYQKTPDVSVFQKHASAAASAGGFDWDYTTEGFDFWSEVILDQKLDVFFEKYPTYPKVMMVSDCGDSWCKRVVFLEKAGKFIAWDQAESLSESEGVLHTCYWNHAKDIEEETIIELTLEDISEGKGAGVPAHLIRIKK